MNAASPISPTSATPFRFTVDQFLALCDQGLFDDYAKSELIEGEIVVMNAQYTRHARVKTNLAFALMQALTAIKSPLSVLVEVADFQTGRSPSPTLRSRAIVARGLCRLKQSRW